MKTKAIGQEEETEVIMTGESVIEGYKKLMEMAEKAANAKKTRFEVITESPEKLAEFIYCLVEVCDYAAGNGAKKILQYANEDANDKRNIELIHGNRDFGELLEWLKQESKE